MTTTHSKKKKKTSPPKRLSKHIIKAQFKETKTQEIGPTKQNNESTKTEHTPQQQTQSETTVTKQL